MKKTLFVSAIAIAAAWVANAAGLEGAAPVAASDSTETNSPAFVVLWGGGTRIPSIDITTNNTLLAFAQVGGGDNHPNNVHLMRSTDGGKTWSGSQDLTRTDRKISYANPSSIVDRDTGIIWAFWTVREKGPQGLISKGPYSCCSTNDGVSWSEVVPLLVEGKPVDGLTTTCRGIQLATSRLILPFTFNGVARTIYSDDHGQTWMFGKLPPSNHNWKGIGSSEYTVLELADGRVYMNHRANERILHKHRVTCLSSDGGISWSNPVSAKDLEQRGTACHSGLIRLTHPKTDDKSRVLFSAPAGPGRANLTIYISYDECASWKPLKVIQTGNAVYSNLIVLPDNTIGCIYEFSDLGAPRKIWQQIRFARFTLEWLTDGADKVTARGGDAKRGGGAF